MRAEAAGYDGVVTMENRHEPFRALGVAAVATPRVQRTPSVFVGYRTAW
jgi:alkanesulfonate monooxygenase SsuD/methylene tetrahydromethanopterin reductase-like flavin-dependent oxidoreductase (luciferase family)